MKIFEPRIFIHTCVDRNKILNPCTKIIGVQSIAVAARVVRLSSGPLNKCDI